MTAAAGVIAGSAASSWHYGAARWCAAAHCGAAHITVMPSTYNNQFREDNGRFGEAIHDQDTVAPLEDSAKTATDRVKEALEAEPNRKFYLAYVDYDDRLMDEQITKLLAGDTIRVWEEIDETFGEGRYDNATNEAKDICDEHGIDWDDLDPDEQEDIRQLIYDRDDSDPVEDLTRNTRDQLMRAPLLRVSDLSADFEGDLYDGSQEATLDNRVTALTRALGEKGVDISDPAVHEAVRELVNENSPYYWHEAVDLDVIWYGPVTDAIPAEASDPDPKPRKLTFDGARVVLIDRVNGSGYDVELPSQVSVSLTPTSHAVLDSDPSRGYGWDEVAGVHKPAYRPSSVSAEWEQPAPVAA